MNAAKRANILAVLEAQANGPWRDLRPPDAPPAPAVTHVTRAAFLEAYRAALLDCAKRGLYAWPPDALDGVPPATGLWPRFREALERGDYSHTGPAIKATCKALGMPSTRTAINAVFSK